MYSCSTTSKEAQQLGNVETARSLTINWDKMPERLVDSVCRAQRLHGPTAMKHLRALKLMIRGRIYLETLSLC